MKIGISEGIEANYYWCFLHKGFWFQPSACNSCHDILVMSNKIKSTDILNNRGVDYRCIISISKSEAVKLF